MVENLLSKQEDLSLIPNTTKKEKKKSKIDLSMSYVSYLAID